MEGERAVHSSSIRLASLIPVSVAIEEQALLDPLPSIPEPTLWDFVALPAHTGSPGFKPPQVPRTEFTASIVEAPRPPRRAVSPMEEVDNYLWEVYRRAPAKRDSTGDFTWKDPAAAKRMGLAMPAYVIGGMDPEFRETPYHARRPLDAGRIRSSDTSAFR